MNWYLQNGKESDVVMNSKIALSRNIAGIHFIAKATNEELKKVFEKMKEITPSIGYGLKFYNMSAIENDKKDALVEKGIIDVDFANNKNPYTAIIINDEENISILVNENDHIKLQIFASGLELTNALNLAVEIDQKLEDFIQYSYHKKYGYLTECPTNVGTGLKATVTVHLPGLSMTGNIRKVLNIVNNLSMNIKGLYSEANKVDSDIYQISNNQTLGITENEIVKNLNLISQKVMEQERVTRKYLAKNSLDLEDKIYRNYGILTNARKLSEDETNKLLSLVKLGVDLGVVKELNDTKISELYLYTKPANLQLRLNRKLNYDEDEIERANIIKQIIEE